MRTLLRPGRLTFHGPHRLVALRERGERFEVWEVAGPGVPDGARLVRPSATCPKADAANFLAVSRRLPDGSGAVVEAGAIPSPYAIVHFPERERFGAVPLDATLAIADRLAAALVALHLRKTCHGEVGPQTLVRDADGGPARLLPPGVRPVEASAPERLRGEGPSRAADAWGIGAVLLHLASGSLPGDELPAEARDHALAFGEAPLHRLAAGAEPLRKVIAALLSLDPSARPTCARARTELLAIREGAAPDLPSARPSPPGTLRPGGAFGLADPLEVLAEATRAAVVGESGAGRTRLLQEALLAAAARGERAIWLPTGGRMRGALLAALDLDDDATARTAGRRAAAFVERHGGLAVFADNLERARADGGFLHEFAQHAGERVRILASFRRGVPLPLPGATEVFVPALAASGRSALLAAWLGIPEADATHLVCALPPRLGPRDLRSFASWMHEGGALVRRNASYRLEGSRDVPRDSGEADARRINALSDSERRCLAAVSLRSEPPSEGDASRLLGRGAAADLFTLAGLGLLAVEPGPPMRYAPAHDGIAAAALRAEAGGMRA